jgi:hypothetical protein
MKVEKLVEENKTSTQTRPKIFSFSYKRTGMGARDDTIIISFRTGKIIKSKLHTSRTGSHGVRSYALLPGRYLVYSVTRSNLGNTYITVRVVEVNGEMKVLQEWKLYEGKEQKMLLTRLPKNIQSLLLNNKNELPLFHYVEDQDLISQ